MVPPALRRTVLLKIRIDNASVNLCAGVHVPVTILVSLVLPVVSLTATVRMGTGLGSGNGLTVTDGDR